MPGDLLPLLRQPVRARVGAHEICVPWHSAQVWLEEISRSGSLAPLFLSDTGRGEVACELAAGTVSLRQAEDAGNTVLEKITGVRWWVALRLVYTSAGKEFLGELTLSGVDPERVSLGQWCAAVYRILVRDADEKQRAKVEFELELPPQGFEDAWDDDEAYYRAMVEQARQMNGQG